MHYTPCLYSTQCYINFINDEISCAAELALLVEGLGVVAEAHLEEWLIRPSEKFTEEDTEYVDDNQIKLFGPDESVSWVATPIVDDWGSQQHTGLLRSGSQDLHSLLPRVDPMVLLLGSFQNSEHFLTSREVYDGDHKREHSDEEDPEDPETPKFGVKRSFRNSLSETDMAALLGDGDDHLQAPLLGGSNYECGRFTPRGHSQDRSE